MVEVAENGSLVTINGYSPKSNISSHRNPNLFWLWMLKICWPYYSCNFPLLLFFLAII